MTDERISIKLQSSFDSKGAKDAMAWAKRVQDAYARPMAPRGDPAAPFRAIPPAARKAEASALAYAQASARLQQAQGNAAGGAKTLSAALATVDKSSISAMRAMTQLANIENRLSNAKGPMVLPRTIAGLSHEAANAVKTLGAMAVAIAGINGIAQAVKPAADLESTLAVLAVNTKASTEEMAAASAKAKQLGADLDLPATSAAGAATAMNELVKGGLNLNTAMDASKGTLQLAAAGMLSEADAAKVTTAALNTFNLAGNQATLVADQFAAGAAATSTDVRGMGDALEQGGGLFASYQVRVLGGVEALTQFNTAVGVLATAGIEGQKAGTYIASAMERVANPTDKARGLMEALADKIGITGNIAYDAQGNMRPFEEIMQNVALATADMSEQQRDAAVATLFMTEGSKAVIPILRAMSGDLKDSEVGWDAIKEKTQAAGAANEQAAARMAGLNGAVAGLQSQVETLATNAFEPLLPLMTDVVRGAAELAGNLSGQVGPAATGLADSLRTLGQFVAEYAVPAMQTLSVVSALYAADTAVTLIKAIDLTTVGLKKQAAAMAAAAGPYVVIAALAAIASVKQKELNEQVEKLAVQNRESSKGWAASNDALQRYTQMQSTAGDGTKNLAANVETIRAALERETEAYYAAEQTGRMTSDQRAAWTKRIDDYKAGLEQATDALNKDMDAQAQAAAATITATSAIDAQNAALRELAEQPLDDAKIAEYQAAIVDALTAGMDALHGFVDTQISFQHDLESAQADHNARMADLIAARAQAGTDKERAAIDERIKAEQEGFKEQAEQAAIAYAEAQAAQNEHLGKLLLDYVRAQALLGKFGEGKEGKERAQALASSISEEFGLMGDLVGDVFLDMAGKADEFAANTSISADEAAAGMARTRDEAVKLQERMDKLQEEKVLKIKSDWDKGIITDLDTYLKLLADVPSQVRTQIVTEMITIENRVIAENTGAAGNQRRGQRVQMRASGGYISGPGSGTSDSIPARLSNGEYVINARATAQNRGLLDAINSGQIQGFAEGGLAGQALPPGVAVGNGAAPASSGRRGGANVARATGNRVQAAYETAQALQEIEDETAQKLIEINNEMHEKLLDLEKEYAKEQLELRRELANDIAETMADVGIDNEVNDFDKYRDGADKDAIEAREAEERAYYERLRNIQETARAEAEQGDAELARARMEAREKELEREKAITEEYNQVRAEARAEDQEALRREYDEAIAASQQKTATEIAIAEQEAAQRAAEKEAAKAEIVQSATEESAEAIKAAEEQASRVKGASAEQKAAVVADLQAQAEAMAAWRAAFGTAADGIIQDAARAAQAIGQIPAPSGAPSATPVAAAAAGGGSFETRGPALILVGDNPGGRERVDVTPLSGKGQTRVAGGGSAYAMAGGGSVTAGGGSDLSIPLDMRSLDNGMKAQISAVKQYGAMIDIIANIMGRVNDIRMGIEQPKAPLDPAAVKRLAQDLALVAMTFAQSIVPATRLSANAFSGYADLVGKAFDPLDKVVELRAQMPELKPPLDLATVRQLADEASAVVQIVNTRLLRATEQQADAFERYGDLVDATASAIGSIADIRQTLSDADGPIEPDVVRRMADEAQQVYAIATARMIGNSAEFLDTLKAWAESMGAAASIISDAASIRQAVADAEGPIDADVVRRLADESQQVYAIALSRMIGNSAEFLPGLQAWADSMQQAASLIQSGADIRASLSEVKPPISAEVVRQLADEAQRVYALVLTTLQPTTEDSNDALARWADAVASSVDVLESVASLSGDLLQDYTSPTDAELDLLARDADRMVRAIVRAASVYETAGLEAAITYADALQGTVGGLMDAAKLTEALQFGDFTLNANALGQLESSAAAMIDTAARLGQRAAAVDPAAYAALGTATAALSGYAEAAIQMAAVPFDTLPSVAGAFGMAGSGSVGSGQASQTINVNIYNPPAQMDVQGVVRQVRDVLRTDMLMRR